MQSMETTSSLNFQLGETPNGSSLLSVWSAMMKNQHGLNSPAPSLQRRSVLDFARWRRHHGQLRTADL